LFPAYRLQTRAQERVCSNKLDGLDFVPGFRKCHFH
jgi:hypothetical protein